MTELASWDLDEVERVDKAWSAEDAVLNSKAPLTSRLRDVLRIKNALIDELLEASSRVRNRRRVDELEKLLSLLRRPHRSHASLGCCICEQISRIDALRDGA